MEDYSTSALRSNVLSASVTYAIHSINKSRLNPLLISYAADYY